jgi:hypothetical protein
MPLFDILGGNANHWPLKAKTGEAERCLHPIRIITKPTWGGEEQ